MGLDDDVTLIGVASLISTLGSLEMSDGPTPTSGSSSFAEVMSEVSFSVWAVMLYHFCI